MIENGTLDVPKIPADSHDTIFEYMVDESGKWVHWGEKVRYRHCSAWYSFLYSGFLCSNPQWYWSVRKSKVLYLFNLICVQ